MGLPENYPIHSAVNSTYYVSRLFVCWLKMVKEDNNTLSNKFEDESFVNEETIVVPQVEPNWNEKIQFILSSEQKPLCIFDSHITTDLNRQNALKGQLQPILVTDSSMACEEDINISPDSVNHDHNNETSTTNGYTQYYFPGFIYDKALNIYSRNNIYEKGSVDSVHNNETEIQNIILGNDFDKSLSRSVASNKNNSRIVGKISRNSNVDDRIQRTLNGKLRKLASKYMRKWKYAVIRRKLIHSIVKDSKMEEFQNTCMTTRKALATSKNLLIFIIHFILQTVLSIVIIKTEYTSQSTLPICDKTQALELIDGKEELASDDKTGNKEKSSDAVENGGHRQELMEQLLSNRFFKVRTNISVYMSPESRWHPQAIDDIPWIWLKEERWRLHTYSRYPHSANKSAILLAEAGFAYVGSGKSNNDKVICYFCCIVKQDWRSTDVISIVHANLSPACSMVTGVGCDNVPMTQPEHGIRLFGQLNSSTEASANVNIVFENGDAVEADTPFDGRNPGNSQPIPHSGHSRGTGFVQSAKPVPVTNQSSGRSSGSSIQASGQAMPVQPSNVSSNAMRNSPSNSSNVAVSNRAQVTTSRQGGLNNTSQGTARPMDTVSQNVQQTSVASSSSTSSSSSQVNTNEQISTSAQSVSPTGSSSTVLNTSATSQSTNSQQGQSSQNSGSDSQNSNRPGVRAPTYSDLGIITERPKRYEYAVKAKRFESFEPWPRDHHLKKEDLAEAGFYYAGYGDCARCFYCGGGLRNWEDNDNVFVEHARWFPKCAFIRQMMGQQFVDVVQDLNKDHDQISFEMVTNKMGSSAAAFQLDTKNMPLKRDPAVMTVIDMGFSEKDVLEAANFVKESFGVLSADKLFEKLEQDEKPRVKKENAGASQAIRSTTSTTKDEVTMNQLKEQNSQLRQQTVCKICMDREVAVVFLPCGHLVSCTDCAAAMKDCPVCRNPVRGIVRAFMG